MNLNYDVIIIGAGPAGATLARLLPRGLKVAVIDKKTGDNTGFKKPCGGLLSETAQKYLGRLGLRIPKDILVSPQVSMVRTFDMQTGRQRYYQRHMINTDRNRFDNWLISYVPNSVDIIRDARCAELKKENGGYTVTYSKNHTLHTITATYIVGADGANSIVRKNFAPKPIRQYTAIQKSYKEYDKKPYFVLFFNSKLSDSYGWINMKDGVIQLGAALPKQNARKSFKIIEEHFKKEGYNLDEPLDEEACLVNYPSSLRELSLGSGNAFLIGEAAGYVSPSSLEGISFALDSAVMLAKAFRFDKPDILGGYKKRSHKLYFRIFTKFAKAAVLYNPFLRNLALMSGFTAVKFYDTESSR